MLACGAMLVLGACTDTKRIGDPGALEELNDLRASLAAAQNALGASTLADQQAAVKQARKDLKAAQTALEARPDGSLGKSEAGKALTSLDSALTKIEALLTASASGASGPVALASMHTTLTEAQTAIDAAQADLKKALAAAPAADTALLGLLTRAQAALTTAQVTLVPRLSRVLVQAEQAEAALNALRVSLAAAQAALGASTPAEQQAAVERARTDLKTARAALEARPDGSPGKSEATEALTALDLALTAVDNALGASASGASGPVALASMHTTLAEAQTAIDAAQVKLKAAVAAAPATDTALRGLLSQAQAALTTAQVSLVPKLRSELAAAEERADTYDPRTTLNDALLPARTARIGLPLSLTPKGSVEADAEGPAVTWTRRTRTDVEVAAGVTTATVVALDNDIMKDAVPWATGKTLGLGAAGAVSTDEFALRGITMRGGRLGLQNPDGTRRSSGIDGTYNPPVQGHADAGAWRNWNAAYESSIQMKEDGGGITLKMGGDGTIFFDFERLRAIGGAAVLNQPENAPACVAASLSTCDDVIASDVKATFGTPVADPDGEAAWHFKMRVPVNPDAPHVDTRSDYHTLPTYVRFVDDDGNTLFRAPDENGPYTDENGQKYRVERTPIVTDLATTLAADPERAEWMPLEANRAQRIARGRPSEELGVYNTWLSNYAGLDTGDDADDPSDDTHRYLDYAAYGLFNFLDYSTRGMNFARAQAFHFGYDAFTNDGDDAVAGATEPGGWGTALTPITATFNGRTTGWLIRGTLEEADRLTELIRMRGDVKLTAEFNGVDMADDPGHGTVSGSMNNFEFLRNDIWSTDVNYRILRNDPAREDKAAVLLQEANIGADGSFSGVAAATYNGESGVGVDNFDNGTYGGAFYGDRKLGELEAAGYWNLRMNAAGGNPDSGRGALIGSFGAVSEPEE